MPLSNGSHEPARGCSNQIAPEYWTTGSGKVSTDELWLHFTCFASADLGSMEPIPGGSGHEEGGGCRRRGRTISHRAESPTLARQRSRSFEGAGLRARIGIELEARISWWPVRPRSGGPVQPRGKRHGCPFAPDRRCGKTPSDRGCRCTDHHPLVAGYAGDGREQRTLHRVHALKRANDPSMDICGVALESPAGVGLPVSALSLGPAAGLLAREKREA
jgi:hypothetical protein